MERNRWDQVEELLFSLAEGDLAATGEVGPALVAFSGDQLLFVAWLRPFEAGRYHDPMIELLALAMALDADRLALSVAGRAWSLDDPIPPVSLDADLRQRVHMVHVCDGTGGDPRTVSVLRPFDLDGEVVRWGPEHRSDGVEGWVPQVLGVSVRERHALRASLGDVLAQAVRVVTLGHDLNLSPELAERLGLDQSAGTTPTGQETPVPPRPQ